MIDIRKIIIIFVIAILFSVLVFAVIEAVYPQPKYEDYCKENFYPKAISPGVRESNCTVINVPESYEKNCTDSHGVVQFTNYDSGGCAKSYKCSTCDYKFQQANEKHSRYVFYISAILALIAIFIGLYLPAKENTLNEWMGTGFMLGGAFALFFGTAMSYSSLDRYVRPIVMLLELALVVFVAYKKIGNLREEKRKKKKR